jgi:CheY-like chemotaxis protein/MinD-like ATPase involved in chromosome partitioning or flagellar assembly
MTQSILVVDDDSDTLTLIGLTLQRRGFSVKKAQSGPEALNLLHEDLPDLVIADVMMPMMDGYEVCRSIKGDPRTAHLPVVMLTAKAQTSSQLEGFRAGAIDYITKPVHPQELIARITAVLERVKEEAARVGADVITVAGAKGGVGATTLAVNLALAYATRCQVMLLDLEMSGMAAIHLGLSPEHGLSDIAQLETGPTEPEAIEHALTPHTSGLKLLAASDVPLEPARAGVLVGHAAMLCDVCLIDLGWGVGQMTRLIAQRSKVFVIALDSDRATLSQATRLLHLLNEANVPAKAVKLVWINRLGIAREIGLTAIRAALSSEPDAIIDSAVEEMYMALEQGRPLVLSYPDHPAAGEIIKLADSLTQPAA